MGARQQRNPLLSPRQQYEGRPSHPNRSPAHRCAGGLPGHHRLPSNRAAGSKTQDRAWKTKRRSRYEVDLGTNRSTRSSWQCTRPSPSRQGPPAGRIHPAKEVRGIRKKLLLTMPPRVSGLAPPVPILIEEVGEDNLRAHLRSDLVTYLACSTAPPAENICEDQNSRPRSAPTFRPDLANVI